MRSATSTLALAPVAVVALIVQVRGPPGVEPAHPAGTDTIVNPVGGTNVTVWGPGASDGPSLDGIGPVQPGGSAVTDAPDGGA